MVIQIQICDWKSIQQPSDLQQHEQRGEVLVARLNTAAPLSSYLEYQRVRQLYFPMEDPLVAFYPN